VELTNCTSLVTNRYQKVIKGRDSDVIGDVNLY